MTSGKHVTLQYWTWYPDQTTLQQAVDGFEKANPDITVKMHVLQSQDFQKQLPLALNGGQNLDVVGMQVSAMTNTVKDQLRPVSSYASSSGPDCQSTLDPTLLKQAQDARQRTRCSTIFRWAACPAPTCTTTMDSSKAGITSPPTTVSELAADVRR